MPIYHTNKHTHTHTYTHIPTYTPKHTPTPTGQRHLYNGITTLQTNDVGVYCHVVEIGNEADSRVFGEQGQRMVHRHGGDYVVNVLLAFGESIVGGER